MWGGLLSAAVLPLVLLLPFRPRLAVLRLPLALFAVAAPAIFFD